VTMSAFTRQLQAGLRVLLILTILTGIVYPLVILGVGQVVAHGQADGSLVEHAGIVVGSSSLGQQVTGPQWFHDRVSAVEYVGNKSGGSNLGPNEPGLAKALQDNGDTVRRDNPDAPAVLPPDALTTSASGLDPDISPEYAALQVGRVAAARGLTVSQVQAVVATHTKGRILGFLGEPRVNVTELNVALADMQSS